MSNEFSRRTFLEGLALGGACAYGIPFLIDVARASPLNHPAEQGHPVVDTLPPGQLESGLVTRQELALAEKWLTHVTDTSDGKPEWTDKWLSTALPFSFQYGGKRSDELLKTWQLKVGEREAGPVAVEQDFVWNDEVTGLKVIWKVKRFINYPAVDWLLYFENKGSNDTPILEDIQALDLRISHSQKDRPFIVHGALGGRQEQDDLMPFATVLPDPQFMLPDPQYAQGDIGELVLGGNYPTHSHLPFFNLETPEKRGVLVTVGWSGNWMAHLTVKGHELRARTGMKGTHFVLKPGERVRSPRILLLFWEGMRLHSHNMQRQLLHRCYIPRLRGKLREPLVTFNMCYACHTDCGYTTLANAQNVLPRVKPVTQLGAEVFILDAGWYELADSDWQSGLGDWQYSRTRYPEGFLPISQPLAARNIAFGLWMAPEIVGRKAPVYRENPEFIRPAKYGGDNRGNDLRMELPEAREWFLKYIDDYAQNQGLTCFRQDLQAIFGEEPQDRQGIAESKHYAGFYELLDTMRARHPDMINEASGLMTGWDLEAISRFHWGQMSDRWFNSESDHCSLYGLNLYVPGGALIMFTEATDDYGAWSSFAGQFALAWDPLDPAFPMEQARLQVERYKRIRRYLSGDFYPLTSCSLEQAWIGYQFHRMDLDQGVCFIFRRRDSDKTLFPTGDTLTARLRGLTPGKYQVRFEGGNRVQTISSEVLSGGAEIVLRTAPAAEMMIYERVG